MNERYEILPLPTAGAYAVVDMVVGYRFPQTFYSTERAQEYLAKLIRDDQYAKGVEIIVTA
jgi:hypothetical protein